jgi:hypothetical protein
MLHNDDEIAREMAEEKTDEELAVALDAHRGNPFSWWRIGLGVLTLAAVVVFVLEVSRIGKQLTEFQDMTSAAYAGMFGDDEGRIIQGNTKKRWESESSDKAKFMEHVVTTLASNSSERFIDEMLADARRVDPENSYYFYIAAAKNVSTYREGACLKKIANKSTFDREIGDIQEWEVINEEKFKQALSLVKEAGSLQGISYYRVESELIQLAKFREMKVKGKLDSLDQYLAVMRVMMKKNYSMKMLDLGNLFDAKFYQLSKNGTAAEVKFWINEHRKLINFLVDRDLVLVDKLIAFALMRGPLPNMRAAAIHAGMETQAEKITMLLDEFKREKEQKDAERLLGRSSGGGSPDMTLASRSRDSSLMYTSGRGILKHLNGEEMKLPPMREGRFADHAFAGRLFSLVSFLILSLGMIVMWIFLFAQRKKMRSSSLQGLCTLRLTDGMLVIGIGVVSPVVFYVIINEFTPLSVREWSLFTGAFSMVIIQYAGMLLSVLSLSAALLHWRLSVRLPDLVTKVRVLSWVLPGLAVTAVITVGLSDAESETVILSLAGMFCSLALLGWLTLVCVSAFMKRDAFTKVIMCRGMLLVYASVLIILAALSIMYHQQEKCWVSESEEITFKAEHLGLMKVEYDVAQKMRAQLIERLESIR